MNILNNTWFVGIFGGIISGIIVYFITVYFANKFSKKEYLKTVKELNLKISKTLIMSISEGKIPSPEVIDSLLSSTAKRNNVDPKDLNNVQETYDDLISELFETIFIPVEKKQNLANELILTKKCSLATEYNNNSIEHPMEFDHVVYKREQVKKYILSLMFVSIISLSVILLVLVQELSNSVSYSDLKKMLSIMSISFVTVVTLLSFSSMKKSSDKFKKLYQNNKSKK